jgi:hypothetical protein
MSTAELYTLSDNIDASDFVGRSVTIGTEFADCHLHPNGFVDGTSCSLGSYPPCFGNVRGVSKKFGEWYHKKTKQKIQTN